MNANKKLFGALTLFGKAIGNLVLTAGLLVPTVSFASTDLADQPVFTSTPVPGNLLLTLSVEYPTANSIAYPTSFSPWVTTSGFIGYFDPAKCYDYYYDSSSALDSSTNGSFFFPVSAASSTFGCTSTSTSHLWSGSFLNWASMQTIDPFRWALTGGYRSTDASASGTGNAVNKGTILEKAWASGQGSAGETPNRSLAGSSTISAVSPFSWSNLSFRIWGLGNRMQFTNTASFDSSNGSTTGDSYTAGTTSKKGVYTPSTNNAYNPLSSNFTDDYSGSGIYTVIIRARVCDSVIGLESNCVGYMGSDSKPIFKPEGLMQQYSGKIRYGVFGYLNDSGLLRDGGVLRANMNYIGPTQPVPGTTPKSNTNPEWSGATGVMFANPDPADASGTVTSGNATISNSGVMNYLNKFGRSSGVYKTYDPVSELYYSGIRYYKAFASDPGSSKYPVPANSEVSTYSSGVNSTMADGFPVITGSNWKDPIIYACQKNFILGIGDVNTHADGNLPGSTTAKNNSTYEPSAPSDMTADTTIGHGQTTYSGSSGATTYIGSLEGVSNLGSTNLSWCCSDDSSYLMAGIAYDSHVNDITPNKWTQYLNTDGTKTFTQTISTYWVDVLENQKYQSKNQYWYATKYGGFTLPSGYKAYDGTKLTQGAWSTGLPVVSTSTDLQPNNYYPAFQAKAMVQGLTNAFQSIAAQTAQTTTAQSASSPKIPTAGGMNYAASYDSSKWIGDVVGTLYTFSGPGAAPTTQGTPWSAQKLLQTQIASNGWNSGRVIASYSGGKGVPFRPSSLSTTDLSKLDPGTSLSSPNNISNSTTQTNYLNYVRGDQSNEVGSAVTGSTKAYRARAAVLGDIVDSKLNAVGPPALGFSEANNPGYTAFKATYASRNPVVYVGANDGMLHAFDGTKTGGSELFAYIPGALYSGPTGTPLVNGLAAYGNPTFVHHNYVDATVLVNDLDMARTNGNTQITTSKWASLLVGPLGKGGQGYYALDVTNPPAYSANNGSGNSANEQALANAVKWEVNSSQAAYNTMGYSYGPPIIVKTKQYGWVVIVTSGYNNSDGNGYLYIIDPPTGNLLQKIQASDGSSVNSDGLAYAAAFVPDTTDFTAETVYAGDLQGNVWRFDLTAATGNYPAPTRIAHLTDSSGNNQPVTVPPLIVTLPNTLRRYVFVGTGKLLGASDVISNKAETFYAIADGTSSGYYMTSATGTNFNLPTGVTFPLTRSELNANTDLINGIGTAPTSAMGWYYDMGTFPGTSSYLLINTAIASNLNYVGWVANAPSGDVCSPSGNHQSFTVDIATGKTILTNGVGGSPVSYISGTGLGTSFSIVSINDGGGVEPLVGDDGGMNGGGGHVTPLTGSFSNSGSGQLLNWREVPVNN
ncbi:pilus assembly protein [Silvimonas soli]|uniref:pilus assembly protein n=1 Tax=Silvimonas soli TaxID=2980100 RepID=UPI0024B32FC9|nr:PilC/PilY family type IV pilus protein [Silvimonas soli]